MKTLMNAMHPLMLKLPPEVAHNLSMTGMRAFGRLSSAAAVAKTSADTSVELLGIRFPNRVGLAAGLDKDGHAYNGFFHLGFGFIEVGTVTPRPQPGNPKPRMFRLPERQALINRMGFNNLGIDALVHEIKQTKPNGVIGINIGKNKTTPEENAADDYVICLEKAYLLADYITVNVSSPNTPGLRNLQFGEALSGLLGAIKERQAKLADLHSKYVPILVKIAPDIEADDIPFIVNQIRESGLDGIIATNTTVNKEAVEGIKHGTETGGLSGAPLTQASTEIIRKVRASVGDDYPLIGVGGIMTGQDALDKLEAGADLIQLYTGFIYRGPALIEEARAAIKKARP